MVPIKGADYLFRVQEIGIEGGDDVGVVPFGLSEIRVNGAVGRFVQMGDVVMIAAFSWMPESKARQYCQDTEASYSKPACLF